MGKDDQAEANGRRLMRRAFHIAVSLAVLYYWFPPTIRELGISRETLMVVAFGALSILEGVRLWRGGLVFPMREYERRQLGGHFWLVLGCVVALLFFEQRFAMITILGTTLVDPLIGEMRGKVRPPFVLAAGFFAWLAVAIATITVAGLATPLALLPIGAAVAVAAERRKVPRVDDDFLMNVVPLVVLTALAITLGL